jgi:imidazole glycerol phosphate synthase subunit HisF
MQMHDKIAKHMTKDIAGADEVSIACENVCLSWVLSSSMKEFGESCVVNSLLDAPHFQ